MRFLLDTYIQADASQVVSDFEDTGLVQLIVQLREGRDRQAPGGDHEGPWSGRRNNHQQQEDLANRIRERSGGRRSDVVIIEVVYWDCSSGDRRRLSSGSWPPLGCRLRAVRSPYGMLGTTGTSIFGLRSRRTGVRRNI